MGQRGPKPTPTPILQLRGSTLVTRRRRQREARGPAGRPDPPDWLLDDPVAKSAWEQLVPMLTCMDVLTRIDGNALARYCRLWSRWRKAEEFISKNGDMFPIKDDNGKVKCLQQWPQVAIAHKLAQQLTKLEAEFGMTPSARARMQLPGGGQEGEGAKARFFEAG